MFIPFFLFHSQNRKDVRLPVQLQRAMAAEAEAAREARAKVRNSYPKDRSKPNEQLLSQYTHWTTLLITDLPCFHFGTLGRIFGELSGPARAALLSYPCVAFDDGGCDLHCGKRRDAIRRRRRAAKKGLALRIACPPLSLKAASVWRAFLNGTRSLLSKPGCHIGVEFSGTFPKLNPSRSQAAPKPTISFPHLPLQGDPSGR